MRLPISLTVPVFATLFAGCVVSAEEAAPADDPGHGSQQGWDSQDGNPTHATHSYLTEFAIDQLRGAYPEVQTYRAKLVDGSNRELHELPVANAEQEALRREVEGTNWAANHPERLWDRARRTYAAGDKAKAYWYVGIILHYVEDMGVPSHTFHVVHQGTLSQKDNFEVLALQSWSPSYGSINRTNPRYASPADYVTFNGAWTASDFTSVFPNTNYTLSFFPMTWLFMSGVKTTFVKNRQGRTAMATRWALEAAVTHWQ